MRERFVTLICALGALALFLGIFLRRDEGAKDGDLPRPTTAERRFNGYHGALVWLDQEHIRTVSWRDRFNELLGQTGLAPAGNLLVVTLPAAAAFKTEELRPLESWIRAGNTLLVLAALADNPNWAFAVGRPAAADLSLLTGLELMIAKAGPRGGDVGSRIATSARAFVHPRTATLVPNGPLPLLEGVHAAQALSDYPAQSWTMKIPYDGFALALAHERETGEAVLWLRPLGRGQVIVSGFGSLFTNGVLGRGDNGQLLANLVAGSLRPGGAVLFDDMHQGLDAAYDPAKFYSDPRLYESVAILAAVWLCWVLGSSQLRRPASRLPGPREAELVRAMGGFLARVLTNDAGARGLFDHFFQSLGHSYPGGGGGRAAWDLLEGHAGVAAADLQQLKAWHAAAVAARKVPLERLHNVMLKIKARLTS
jgi:hypothetical protein